MVGIVLNSIASMYVLLEYAMYILAYLGSLLSGQEKERVRDYFHKSTRHDHMMHNVIVVYIVHNNKIVNISHVCVCKWLNVKFLHFVHCIQILIKVVVLGGLLANF